MEKEKTSFFQSTFFIRTCSGIVLVLLALFFIISGGNILLGGLSIISLIGMSELYKVMKIDRKLLGFTGYLLCVLYYAHLYFAMDDNSQVVFLVILSLILLLAVYVFCFPAYRSEQVMTAFFGIFYVAVMLSYIYLCRMMDGGAYLVWLVFLCSWGCDTCAYLTGICIGKHKMAPVLSPKKSIEGAVGGVIGAVLLGILYGYVFQNQIPAENASFLCAVVCGIGSLISMIGDLAASAIKRNHEVKDYGTLIPGHGGILDRFDSVIFTAPVIYYTIQFLMK